jgi:hypothetical protein
LRNNSTVAPGAAVPVITALPAGPTSAISKVGITSSPLPSECGGAPNAGAITRESDPSSPTPAVGAATAAAAIASPVFTGGCLSRGKPETNAAPHAAVSARNRMAIRPIHAGVMVRNRWPKSLARQQPPKINDVTIGLGIQVLCFSSKAGRLPPILIASAIAVVATPASSRVVLARKTKWFIAQREMPGQVGLLRYLLFRRCNIQHRRRAGRNRRGCGRPIGCRGSLSYGRHASRQSCR